MANAVAKNHRKILPTALCPGNQMGGFGVVVAGQCPCEGGDSFPRCKTRASPFSSSPKEPAACLVLAAPQQCKQLPLRDSRGCPGFNSTANCTHKFRVQLIVVLWSRCSSGKKICKHSDALLSRELFVLGEE